VREKPRRNPLPIYYTLKDDAQSTENAVKSTKKKNGTGRIKILEL